MKNIFLKIRLVVLTNLIFLSVSAHDFEVGGIYYNVTSFENLEVEVTSYCDYQDDEYDEHKYSGDIVIPETVTYKNRKLSVTSIGSGAFRDCSSLTSVDIPNSVTMIGESAFYNCDGLTSIEIPNSVTSIESDAFMYCSSLTSVEIPNSVTSIESGAFMYCSSLTSVEIPNSVTSIGSSAFRDCSSLTSVDIPNSVTSIGSSAFRDCSSLTSVDIPNSVTTIEYYAFYGCTGLTSIDIPDGVTEIGIYAFNGCTGLTSIDIPNSVTTIGNYAFNGCTGLTSVKIGDSVTEIGYCAFSKCDTIETFSIPAKLETLPTLPTTSVDDRGSFPKFKGLWSDSDLPNIGGVKKLHIASSILPLSLQYCKLYKDEDWAYNQNNQLVWIGWDYYYYYETYYLNTTDIYIGREIKIDEESFGEEYYIFPNTIKNVEIGGSLKSDKFLNINGYYRTWDYIGLPNICTVTYGDSIAEITDPVTTASEIYLRSTTPPVTAEWKNSNYLNSILYVPQGTLAVYQNADVWKNFWDIREWNATTDVKSPTIDNADAADISIDGKQVTVTTNNPGTRVQIYNTDGVLVYDGKEGTVNIGTPGLYIIKAGNLTKKLLVK